MSFSCCVAPGVGSLLHSQRTIAPGFGSLLHSQRTITTGVSSLLHSQRNIKLETQHFSALKFVFKLLFMFVCIESLHIVLHIQESGPLFITKVSDLKDYNQPHVPG